MYKQGIYRHFKGNLYELLTIATHSETLELMIIYRALGDTSKIWVRPAIMWEEQVEFAGTLIPRFKFLGKTTDTLQDLVLQL